jgi:hypothetical protein
VAATQVVPPSKGAKKNLQKEFGTAYNIFGHLRKMGARQKTAKEAFGTGI